jgi:hypothetical protein
MKTKVLYVGGYSRAGKSTVLNELVAHHNFTKISTSDYLTKETLFHFGEPVSPRNIELFTNKDEDYDKYFRDTHGYGLRDAKIHVAEDVIVPELGRFYGLVLPAIREYYVPGENIVCEVFNHEELESWQRAIKESLIFKYSELAISIRRSTELTDVDNREPFGIQVHNNGKLSDTVSEILRQFTKLD